MKLREKTLIILGMTIVCSIIVMYMASNVILIGGFQAVEEQNTLQNIQLSTNMLSNEISGLNGTLYDWAVWDDTYNFIQDHNSRYIQSNLVNSTFTDLKLNLIIYTDNSGNIVYSKGFDLQKKEITTVPESVNEYISKDSILLSPQNENGVKGVILLPEGPMIIASHPILTSNGNGPSKGTLIFGRYLNEVEIQHISDVTQSSLTLFNYNSSNMPYDFQNARQSLSESSPFFINPLNDSYIAGYALVNDIYGKPAFILRIDKPRGFYKEYQNTLFYFLLSLLIMGCVLAMATLIYLDKSILSRLSKFSQDITDIGKKGNLSVRIAMKGEDELSSLAKSINGMLSKIENSQDQLKKSELEFRSLVQLANNAIILTDSNGKIILWNKSAQRMFGYNENEILGKPISILFPDKYIVSYQKVLNNPYNFTDSEDMGETYESCGFKKDKTKFMLEISHISWKIKDEKFYCAIIRDITDRKRAENEIKESLREKEVLLMEIHHRVKNNMQIVSSLLSLQSRYIKDKEASGIFKESQDRVKSMAMIHEKLYMSEGLAKIDFAEYIKNLVNDLFRSYGINQEQIRININADKIFLNIDTAIPCGLIINELVTNSLKYAFPWIKHYGSLNSTFVDHTTEIRGFENKKFSNPAPKSHGLENKKFSNNHDKESKIYIDLHMINGKFLLTIGDNGIGLPNDTDFESTETLGLRLVKSLVDQLDGTVEFYSNGGAEFKIIFTQVEQKTSME